ncbi:ABC transporter ATP-binding protein [Roseovarius phycicola]|uniref:ABC transporter ATP-binding protein n=1 Tax=Roseovarius phycicola TaxID=3080976 RepID=A0ABZ2HGF6_9RHOB
MIILENLSKVFHFRGGQKCIADQINAVFPSRRSVALLGRNGAGKTSLLKIISGTMDPTEGRVISHGPVSWPVGFAGSFHGDLTGAQNARFVARIYGVDTDDLIEFVEDFAELGAHFHQPFRTYSAGMKSRLAFGVSMGVPFETYLVDEVTSVGDAAFREKSAAVFAERMKTAGAIMVSHGIGQLRALCDAGAVLEKGKLYYYDDLEEAIAHHQSNMASLVLA